MAFVKATKKQAKLRLALEGPAGFGKTYTALTVASHLGKRIAYLDTEAGSASKYAHLFDFDTQEIGPPFDPRRAAEAIGEAVAGGYDVIVIDSLSHFWQGTGGLLEIVDEVARTKYRGDSHRAWKEGGEIERELIDAILRSPIHVIGAMRTKKDYVRQTDEQGKTRIRAAGTKTIQREEFDFEFDVVGRFDIPACLTILKTRVDTLPPETVIDKPGAEFARTLLAWLDSGEANEALEMPSDEDRKRLAGVIAKLSEKDERDWNDVADKYARREFGHGLTAATKTEYGAVVDALEAHLASLAGEPAQELAGVA